MSSSELHLQLDAMRRHAARMVPELALLREHQQEALSWSLETIEQFGGAILADDVGMGKTRVAAAVAKHLAPDRGTVAIVPPSLAGKWRDTFRLFGVEATVLSRYRLWEREPLPDETLIIVDEAHFFRNRKSRGWEALEQRCKGKPVLLVTATPFWNRARDIESLVALFAPDGHFRCSGAVSLSESFAGGQAGHGIAPVLGSVLLMRKRRAVATIPGGAIERRTLEWSASRVERQLSKRLDELSFPLIESSSHADLIRMFLRLRLGSSTEALLTSIQRQRRYVRRAAGLMRRGYKVSRSSISIPRGSDLFQELLFPDFFSGIDRTASVELDELDREAELLRDLEESLSSDRGRPARLFALLRSHKAPAIIFVNAVETARVLTEYCAHRGEQVSLVSSRVARDGGEETSREKAVEAFRSGLTNVLVATDVMGEGYDLERAKLIVHYDLPWSPVRLHQREGRAWRIDQCADEIEAVAFRVTGLGPAVDEILRRKELELETILRGETPGEAGHPEIEPARTILVNDQTGAIIRTSGRVASFDAHGLVMAGSEENPLLEGNQVVRMESDPARAAFIRWLIRLQEGRLRLPSKDPASPPPWPLDEVKNAIVGRHSDPE